MQKQAFDMLWKLTIIIKFIFQLVAIVHNKSNNFHLIASDARKL